MPESKPMQSVYLDTNALRALSFNKEIAALLTATSQNVIKVCLSECVLWERARQYYEAEIEKNARMITLSDPLPKIVTWFKQVFENHGATIIETTTAHIEKIAVFLQDKNSYFSADNLNDQRDALIFAVALSVLDKNNTLILCEEKNLGQAFIGEGYAVRKDTKKYVEEITANIASPVLNRPNIQLFNDYQVANTLSQPFKEFLKTADHKFPEYERTLPIITDKLAARLSAMQTIDGEIRKRVLGYAQWFSPLSKQDLHKLLEPRSYRDALIENSAQRLHLEELLIDTGNHWLPNIKKQEDKEICEQAMTSVMPEILEIIGLA